MKTKNYLAFDLGAESGRAILGSFSDGKLALSEEHRFLTGPELLPTMYPDKVSTRLDSDCSLVWDFVRFWNEIKIGIQITSKKVKIDAIGVDTWGVDFALLDQNGLLISSPYHYRDSRTKGMMDEAFRHLTKSRIYEITGIQFMPFNTLYQVLALIKQKSPVLSIVDKFLMVPDLINYWLTGIAVAEFSNATTTQFFDPIKMDWSTEIISAMNFPMHIFPKIVTPGTILGPLRESVAQEVGTQSIVIAPATHDTGAAVVAVPADSEDFVWISSGTWSVIGINTPKPVINEQSYQDNFTNEGGVNGSFRFSKNVMGLWVVQQCRQQWRQENKAFSYTELAHLAQKAPALRSFVDTDFSEFFRPGDMPEKVKKYCQLTKQPIPQTEGEIIRAVLEGLALRYRFVIEQLEQMSGREMSTIHIVGGGTKNQLLSQFTADALGRCVITGPIEATAIGNLMVQAIAKGDIKDWKEGVAVVRDSFEILNFEPGDQQPWNQAYEKFKSFLSQTSQAY